MTVSPTPSMPDEANFLLSGYMNKQNFRYWSHENPLLLLESLRRVKKLWYDVQLACVKLLLPIF
jgi:hypothetical protein